MTDKKCGKPAGPFEFWNIDNYETIYWQEREDEYLAFMLKLYQSQRQEWSYEVNELTEELAKKIVNLRFVQAPSLNEIMSTLAGIDLKLLNVPEQIVEKELSKYNSHTILKSINKYNSYEVLND